jgi:ComF family protein
VRFNLRELTALARRAPAALLDLVYPRPCCGCAAVLPIGAADAVFCAECTARVRVLRQPLCPLCGGPAAVASPDPCGRCTRRPPSFRRARSWAYYSTDSEEKNPVARALWAFKYRGRTDIGWRLGALLSLGCPFDPGEHDVVMPVPLHPARLRRRGFNQAWMLAAPVARRLGTPITGALLRRVRSTASQVALAERDRRRNVRGAFAVSARRAVAGLRVLLVDDVFTTGATVAECARALHGANAAAVDALTVARAMAARPSMDERQPA